MATFYIQLQDKLLQISGDLTTENISKALGYVPVSPNVTNDLSQRVDNITFDSLKDNPFLQDGSGELNIVDEAGNIIAKIDAEGIHSVDFITGEHKLSDKTDKTYVDEVIKNVKVDLTGYATEEYVNNIDFYNINNNPIVNNGDDKLLLVDENGYIGLQLEEDGLYVKDVIADGHTLSSKADKSELPTKVSELENDKGYLTEHQDISHLATKAELPTVPTKTSELTNDSGFITINDVPEVTVPTKTSELTNDSGFITINDVPVLEIPEEYATKEWVNNKNYATEYDLNNIDYSSIKNTPTTEDETGELNITDENGNIGMKVSSEAVYAKEFISGGHKLSEKVNKDYVDNSIAELVDGAPETLNTLNELAAALKDNADIVDVLNQSISSKQDTLVSGSNIKTINGESILGGGDITIEGGTQVQSDWNETDTMSPAYIANKPIKDIFMTSEGFTTHSYHTLLNVEALVTRGGDGLSFDRHGLKFYDANFFDWEIHNNGNGTKFLSDNGNYKTLYTTTEIDNKITDKQNKLVSGTNIKTINGESLLGSGDIVISGTQVQSDWNETNATSPAYIVNKPNITYDNFRNLTIKSSAGINIESGPGAAVAMTEASVSDAFYLGDFTIFDNDGSIAIEDYQGDRFLTLKGREDGTKFLSDDGNYKTLYTTTEIDNKITDKQDTLVSGSNIKTINGNSLLGGGDITIIGDGTQVQSDWNETDTTSSSYIANKPNIIYIGDDFLTLKGTDDGTKFLADDGTYKEINRGEITTETDPIFSASPAATITTSDIEIWNDKVALIDDMNADIATLFGQIGDINTILETIING